MEHSIRKTAIALRLADLLSLDENERIATYYVGLIDDVYCHADAHEQAKWFGDDISFKASTEGADLESFEFLLTVLRRLGAGEAGLARARRVAAFPRHGFKEVRAFLYTHGRLQAEFASRLGLPRSLTDALGQSYERWDGKGVPDGVKGESLPISIRIVTIADLVEVHHRGGGVGAAGDVAAGRAGRALDPGLVGTFREHASDVLDGLDETSSWDAVVGAEPGLARLVRDEDLDEVLEAMADLVDMKSPWMAGHSRGVANLVGEAARISAMAADDVVALRRAGFVHDLGRLGVSNSVWDKPSRLTAAELERVRLHPYLTDRILASLPSLARIRRLAARVSERLDGSGYPSALGAGELSPGDRLLAAAHVYHAMTEPRPHRAALPAETAASELRVEVRSGRLDGDAVAAVLKAAGHRAPARRDWPRGLTAREVEVLGLLARGSSNKQIAQQLVVTPRTVATHIEHIYSKLDVSSRAGATLFASQNGLVGSFETARAP